MKFNIKKVAVVAITGLMIASCSEKLDLFPTNDLTPERVYSTADGYKQVLAKVYGGLALTGNTGPAGSPDVQGLDEGSQTPFIRSFFNMQELPTDEAIVAWNDQTIWDFHNMRWTSSDPFIRGMYARPIYNITIGNEYLRESADDKLAARNITGSAAEDIKKSRAEVRFLRAFNYWVMMDLFGKSTFITENDLIGTNLPNEISRTELFNYIETELKAIESSLGAAKTAEYGRVDQAAAWALLARMYLNASTYTGTARNADALTYAKKVIDAGYALEPNYPTLFMADNDKRKNEFIFTINCDGLRTRSFGNTTFLTKAAAGGDFADYGMNEGWSGYRTTKALVNKFADNSGNTDKRALFTNLSNMEINSIDKYDEGAHVRKFRNIRSDGQPTSDVTKQFADIDFPVFRLAEMYLIYAEAHLRGGGGTAALALEYLNKIRFRAYGNSYGPGNVGLLTDLDLQLILDERARELYWEGHRRTDLVRYNMFTTATYLWPWKGGVSSGTAVDDKYKLYPIPVSNITANPKLTQNTGY